MKKIFPLIAILTLASTIASSESVAYFETFNSGNNRTPNQAGWKNFVGDSARDYSDFQSASNGGTWNSTGVGAGTYIFEGNSYTGKVNMLYANNLPTGGSVIDVGDVSKIDFHSKGDATAGGFYLTLEVDGSWYRSVTNYSNIDSWTLRTHTFSTDASDWYVLDFTPGGTTDLGGGDYGGSLDFSGTTNPVSSLSGDLNHIGFAIQTAPADANQRFDEISISVIPEPSALMLILTAGATCGLLGRSFRRKA